MCFVFEVVWVGKLGGEGLELNIVVVGFVVICLGKFWGRDWVGLVLGCCLKWDWNGVWRLERESCCVDR